MARYQDELAPRTTAQNNGSVVSVGGTSATLVTANEARRHIIICNDHATQVVYLKFGAAAAVLNSGMRVGPASCTPPICWQGEVRAIASGATTPVTVTEL